MSRSAVALGVIVLLAGIAASLRVSHNASTSETARSRIRTYENIQRRSAARPRFEVTYAELSAAAFHKAATAHLPQTTFIETPVTRRLGGMIPRLNEAVGGGGRKEKRARAVRALRSGALRHAQPRIFALIVTQVNDS